MAGSSKVTGTPHQGTSARWTFKIPHHFGLTFTMGSLSPEDDDGNKSISVFVTGFGVLKQTQPFQHLIYWLIISPFMRTKQILPTSLLAVSLPHVACQTIHSSKSTPIRLLSLLHTKRFVKVFPGWFSLTLSKLYHPIIRTVIATHHTPTQAMTLSCILGWRPGEIFSHWRLVRIETVTKGKTYLGKLWRGTISGSRSTMRPKFYIPNLIQMMLWRNGSLGLRYIWSTARIISNFSFVQQCWCSACLVQKEDLRSSDDPGYYLCDFIYYTSLVEYWRRDPNGPRPVMFLHVPGGYEKEDVERGRQVTLGLISALVESRNWR